jgi:hypothetical protein
MKLLYKITSFLITELFPTITIILPLARTMNLRSGENGFIFYQKILFRLEKEVQIIFLLINYRTF